MTEKEKILYEKRQKYGLEEIKTPCTEEENEMYARMLKENEKLPDNIAISVDENHFYKKENYTQEERNEMLMYEQLELLSKIEGYGSFFFGLAIIGIFLGFIGGMIALMMGLS